jgi:hypothetical protein
MTCGALLDQLILQNKKNMDNLKVDSEQAFEWVEEDVNIFDPDYRIVILLFFP